MHPGYGFLSENRNFSKRVSDSGLAFIGPSADAMGKMGDKIASKIIAKEAGVNTIPGFQGVVEVRERGGCTTKAVANPLQIPAEPGARCGHRQ